MSHWPRSKWLQAAIAMVITTASTIAVFFLSLLPFAHDAERYQQRYPGQVYDNLAPVITAVGLSALTLLVLGPLTLMFLHSRGKRSI